MLAGPDEQLLRGLPVRLQVRLFTEIIPSITAILRPINTANPATVTLPMSPLLHGTAQSMTLGTLAVGGTVVLQPSASVDVDDVSSLVHFLEGIPRAIFYTLPALFILAGVTRFRIAGEADVESRRHPRPDR